MTRDIVDGMGSSGTKGVFQRCAEETLRVLREDSEVIMTVLEVFKHDPLHSWYEPNRIEFLSEDLNFDSGPPVKSKCSEFSEELQQTRPLLARDVSVLNWVLT
jgi:phosphatidylinositol kinase/protein kinase (PI-3  family)